MFAGNSGDITVEYKLRVSPAYSSALTGYAVSRRCADIDVVVAFDGTPGKIPDNSIK
jgi:hypothetical protein